MVLKDIMSISGQPGLFKFIAQGKNAIIVEHLETKKRSSAFSSARVSSLEEISVFTEGEDLPLGKVFDKIHEKENGGPAIDYKSDPEKLKTWFEGILPDYNREKVYVSDIKKIAQWYNILHKLDLLVKEEPKDEVKAEAEVKAEGEVKVEGEVKAEADVDVKTEESEKGPEGENKENTTGKKQMKQKSVSRKENASGAGKEAKNTGKSSSGKKQSGQEIE